MTREYNISVSKEPIEVITRIKSARERFKELISEGLGRAEAVKVLVDEYEVKDWTVRRYIQQEPSLWHLGI